MPAPDEITDIVRSRDSRAAITPAGVLRRARPIYRVFVSSTWLDLQPERRALMDALNRMEEMRFVGMEFFGNRPDDTHDASIEQVDLCEVFVGVIGFRYGSGITEAEYRRARELGLPCFIYLKKESVARPELTDSDVALAEKLTAFKRDLLRDHTVKEFASPEELAANATADLHNWVAARWVSLERDAPGGSRVPSAPLDADRTNVLRLLERIQHDWIEGVLDASLHRRAWLELGLNWRDEAVEHPWDRILVAPDRPVRTLGERDTIADVFASAQNTLLVLGEPGAGKTTTLLELARDLVRRARESAAEPPPVVLALSTWTGRHRSLRDWLIEELNLRYQVPKRLTIAWLDAGRLALLLDGLDEVREDARTGCVTAINAFAHEHAPAGLAVTCRVNEYSALKERLRLRSAICLQPLTAAQIDAYFARAGAGLENLRVAMRDDAALRELAQTPLMLSVMTMAWRDAPAESFRGAADTTAEQRRRQLFDAYVQTALRRKGASVRDAGAVRTLAVLGWLARQMRARGQTLFALEELQPGWLDGAWRQFAYFAFARTLAVLVLGLPFWFSATFHTVRTAVPAMGIGLGVIFTLLDFFLFRWRGPYTPMHRSVLLAVWLLPSATIGAAMARQLFNSTFEGTQAVGLLLIYAVMVVVTVCNLADIRTRDIRASDTIGWSWRQGSRRGAAAIVWWQLLLLVVFAEMAMFGLYGWKDTLHDFNIVHNTGFIAGMAMGGIVAGWRVLRGWRGWLAVARCVALIAIGGEIGQACSTGFKNGATHLMINLGIGYVVTLFGGFTAGIDSTRTRRSGAWFWIKVPLLAGLSVSAAIGIIVAGVLVFSHAPPSVSEIVTDASVFGGAVGLIAFFRFGGFQGVQHFVLRQLLALSGRFPRRAPALLDDAVRLNLLQRVGAGYRFIHALLLEHFAETERDVRR